MPSGARVPTEAYYTTDDGKTFFGGPLTNLPPFTHDGQEAVKAHVFECDGQRFVGYMSLYKKPGDTKWTPGAAGFRIPVTCEDGKPAQEVRF